MSGATLHRPRLGFLGVGWIGRDRMRCIAELDHADLVAVADASGDVARAAAADVGASVVRPDELLARRDLDGIIIATPSAMHAEQSVAALRSGIAVFCQKPLGRNSTECRAVVEAARRADRLLGVDMSYRHLATTTRMHEMIRAGEIGQIFAIDLVFHNAYGPDKAWFRDPHLSGGGCVIDLGIHLVDLASWMLDDAEVISVTSRLYAHGRPFDASAGEVEDYAVARLDLSNGTTINLACSWFLPIGRPAMIRASFYGTDASLELTNVDGSFYAFSASRFVGTSCETLVDGPDAWGGRAVNEWVRQLASGRGFDAVAEDLVTTAELIDRIYRR